MNFNNINHSNSNFISLNNFISLKKNFTSHKIKKFHTSLFISKSIFLLTAFSQFDHFDYKSHNGYNGYNNNDLTDLSGFIRLVKYFIRITV